jgi:hypothetical protein
LHAADIVRFESRLLLMGIVVALAPARAFAADGAPLLTSDDVNALITNNYLRRAPAQVTADLGNYQPRVIADGVDLNRVYVANGDAVECVLARAAAHRQNVARLFTEGIFLAKQRFSILIEAHSLADAAREFDFHSPFPITTPLRDGGTAHMTFMLVGQGKLVLGYDRPGTYTHPDPEYSINGLNGYDLSRYIQMDILGDGASQRSLSNVRVADSPGEPLREFLGPGDFALDRLTLVGSAVAVTVSGSFFSRLLAHVFSSPITPKPIAVRRADPARDARLQSLGCPVDSRWGPRTPPPDPNPAFERAAP